MSKVTPPLVPVQKTEPLILTENEAPGAVQERACAPEEPLPSEAAFIRCAQQAKRGRQ